MKNILLTEGSFFRVSQLKGLEYLLRLSPDRLLSPCCKALGKQCNAEAYGGWESMQIQGHSLGHYLSALAGFYFYTGSEQSKKKLDYTVEQIKNLQRPDGYFGGIPSEPFDKAFTGEFNVERFSLADWWVPWYSVHKIYAGLIDAYLLGKNKDALDIVLKMADWAINGSKNMTQQQFQRMLYCEHGGMCKVYADLYDITKKQCYLDMAIRFIDQEMMNPAMNQIDNLKGHHANTQLPKIIGLAKLYDITGNEKYREGVEFFWKVVTGKRSYVIGGNSIGEHFGLENDEILGNDTCETCNTYNMLEISEYVFKWNRENNLAGIVSDYYERALYNHILASQDPVTGAKTYFVSLKSGSFKVYGTFDDAFWCCTGTGLENPERYNRFIAKEYEDILYINLFIDSTIRTESGYVVEIKSNIPYSSSVTVKVLQKGTGNLGIKIRVPYWAENIKEGRNGYLLLTDCAETNQCFELSFDIKLHIRKTNDNSGNYSILYGPVVLAADYGKIDMPEDIINNQCKYLKDESIEVPVINGNLNNINEWIKIKDDKKLEFIICAKANTANKDIVLRPFYNIHHVRYSVYFNSLIVAVKKINDKVYDFIECGRQQSEIDHSVESCDSKILYADEYNKSCRSYEGKNGFVSYVLEYDYKADAVLSIAFAAKDKGNINVRINNEDVRFITECNTESELNTAKIFLSEKIVDKSLSKENKVSIKLTLFTSEKAPYAPRIFEIKIS